MLGQAANTARVFKANPVSLSQAFSGGKFHLNLGAVWRSVPGRSCPCREHAPPTPPFLAVSPDQGGNYILLRCIPSYGKTVAKNGASAGFPG